MHSLKTLADKFTDHLALSQPEREQKEFCVGKILGGLSRVGIQITPELEEEINMSVHRDLQARRLPPNVKIPSRRNVFAYLKTMYQARGSVYDAIHSLMAPGGWTSSGGSFKLAENNEIDLDIIIEKILEENGKAGFLEVGAGYAGLYGREQEEYSPKGVGTLAERFRDQIGATLEIHLTNLTNWHSDLPEGIKEHGGFIASTLDGLGEEGVEEGSIDIAYSQCAAYFDKNIDIFIAQVSRLLRSSENGGYLIFNGKTEEEEKIMTAADQNGLKLERKKVIGGMNGTLFIFKKI